MPVALINPSVVPAEKEAEFLQAWNESSRHFSSNPGFLGTHLHNNGGVGAGTFQHINIALWESAEAWNSTHGSYKPKAESILRVKHHPGTPTKRSPPSRACARWTG